MVGAHAPADKSRWGGRKCPCRAWAGGRHPDFKMQVGSIILQVTWTDSAIQATLPNYTEEEMSVVLARGINIHAVARGRYDLSL